MQDIDHFGFHVHVSKFQIFLAARSEILEKSSFDLIHVTKAINCILVNWLEMCGFLSIFLWIWLLIQQNFWPLLVFTSKFQNSKKNYHSEENVRVPTRSEYLEIS